MNLDNSVNDGHGDLVTVVMPMHNSEARLSETLDSLVAQKYSNFELICIDDASSDATCDVVSRYSDHDSRIRLEKLDKSNAGHVRNNGTDLAHGAYIVYLDSDDVFEDSLLSDMVSALIEDQSDISVCEYNTFSDLDGSPISEMSFPSDLSRQSYSHLEIEPYLFHALSNSVWNKMFRVDFIRENHISFQEQNSTNDAFFVACALALAKRVSLVRKKLVHYRVGVGSSIQDHASRECDCQINAAEAIHAFVCSHAELSDEGRRSLDNCCIPLCLGSLEKSQSISKVCFTNMHKRVLNDINKWGISKRNNNYLIESDQRFKFIAFCNTDDELLYWACRVRSASRYQSRFRKARYIIRLLTASALGSLSNRQSIKRSNR